MYDDADFVNTLITNLRVLKKINEGDKLNTRNKYWYLEPVNSFSTTFWRTFWGDSRERTYESIQQLFANVNNFIEESIILIEAKEMYSIRLHHLVSIQTEVKGALDGVERLKQVYVRYDDFVVRLDTLLKVETKKTDENLLRLKNFLVKKSEKVI